MPRIGHYGSFKESHYVIQKDCHFLVEFDEPMVLPIKRKKQQQQQPLILSIVHLQPVVDECTCFP